MEKAIWALFALILLNQNTSLSQNGLDFDGTNDVVQTTYSGITGSADRTFEAWIYLTAAPSGNSCILDYGVNAVGSRNTFYVNSSRRVGFISGGTNANISSGTVNLVPLNQWVHVAFVLKGGTGYIYINGVQEGTGNLSSVNTPSTGTNLRIGNRVTGGSIPFNGVIDEVRVWNVARTQTQIAAAMNNEFCSAPSGLQAYYKFNQGTAGGSNTTVTLATDDAGTNNGTLTNFTLTGSSSNWVTGKSIFPVAIGGTFPITSCGSYTMPNGTIVSAAGTYYDTVSSSPSCDSLDIYVVNLTSATITNVVSDTGCGQYVTPLGKIVTSSGTYYDTVSSVTSCDTLIQYDIVLSGTVNDSVFRTGAKITSTDTWADHQWVRCDSNFKPIVGETNHFIDVTQVGDYAVIVKRGACVDTSECINISLTSIGETRLGNLSLFPNPTNGIVTVSTELTVAAIQVLDVSGKTVFIANNENSIDLHFLPSGLYFVKINTQEGTVTKKIIKE